MSVMFAELRTDAEIHQKCVPYLTLYATQYEPDFAKSRKIVDLEEGARYVRMISIIKLYFCRTRKMFQELPRNEYMLAPS